MTLSRWDSKHTAGFSCGAFGGDSGDSRGQVTFPPVFRMTVQDVFAIRNRGVVATGRVEHGYLRVGDEVHINGGPGVRVDGIEAFRKVLDEATAGDTIGVLFSGLDTGQLSAGDVITKTIVV